MKNVRLLGMFVLVLLTFSCTDNLLNDIELDQSQKNENLHSREGDPLNTTSFSPNELVIQYKEGTTTEQISDFRKLHQEDIAKVRTCDGCLEDTFIIELWELVEGIDPIEKKGVLKSNGGGGPEDIILAVDSQFSFTKGNEVISGNIPSTNNQNFVPKIANNRGIVIGVVDTGVDAHYNAAFGSTPFLHNSSSSCQPQIHSGWDFANHDDTPFDDDARRHGTKVTSIITNKLRNTGVIYEILPVKVFKSDRSTSYFDILCGVNYALKNSDVVNLSFGYYLSGVGNAGDIFKNLLNRYDHIPVIASAGNDDRDNDARPHYPSSHQIVNVISVGASDKDDEVTEFSNYGFMSVDFCALGQDVSFSDPNGAAILIHGTSFSAATVTARVAEYIYRNIGSSYIVKDIIIDLDINGKPISGPITKPTHYNKVIK